MRRKYAGKSLCHWKLITWILPDVQVAIAILTCAMGIAQNKELGCAGRKNGEIIQGWPTKAVVVAVDGIKINSYADALALVRR